MGKTVLAGNKKSAAVAAPISIHKKAISLVSVRA
jgi:hypothetical protein